MNPIVRAIEIWSPALSGTWLELSAAHYGSLETFASGSRSMKFLRGEGLPGRAWATARPTMLVAITNSYFKRTALAAEAGLVCGLALPYFEQDRIAAVVVLFFGSAERDIGAVEVWRSDDIDGARMASLADGFFASAEISTWGPQEIIFDRGFGGSALAWRTRFAAGAGLPGSVLAGDRPSLLSAADGAAFHALGYPESIDTALGLPWRSDPHQPMMITTLSGEASPVARRFEIWEREAADGAPRLVKCVAGGRNAAVREDGAAPAVSEEDIVSLAAATRRPQLAHKNVNVTRYPVAKLLPPGMKWGLALPLPGNREALLSIVALYG